MENHLPYVTFVGYKNNIFLPKSFLVNYFYGYFYCVFAPICITLQTKSTTIKMEKKKYESPSMKIYEMNVNPGLLYRSCGYHRGNDSADESEGETCEFVICSIN